VISVIFMPGGYRGAGVEAESQRYAVGVNAIGLDLPASGRGV
jgi:hypothetical protein